MTCATCGLVAPPPNHKPRQCWSKCFVHNMEGLGNVSIPRRWTRAFRKMGVAVVHGPVSMSRMGNWIDRGIFDTLMKHRRSAEFRKLPDHVQAAAVVWWCRPRPLSPVASPQSP